MEEAASLLSDAAIPYSSELLPDSPSFSTEIFITEGQRIKFSRVITTGKMFVKSHLPADAYALVLDLGGGIGPHKTRKQIIEVNSETAFLQSPSQSVEILTEPGYEALFLRFPREAVMGELERMLGREVFADLIFAPALPLQSAAGVRLRQICGNLRRILYSTDFDRVAGSAELRQLEDDLITLLLFAQPHNYTRLLNRQNEAGDRQLDAAEQYMRAHAQLQLSLGDICRAAGVNARTLQNSFRKRRGCTPMEFLRTMRIEEVQRGLLHPSETTTVSGEAARWGFLHFGRFSSDYRTRFGELPSETLRRSRSSAPKPKEE